MLPKRLLKHSIEVKAALEKWEPAVLSDAYGSPPSCSYCGAQQTTTPMCVNCGTIPLVKLDFDRLHAEVEDLRKALRSADAAIVAGQACRSEAEFTRWMRESQQSRPHADLLLANSRDKRPNQNGGNKQ